MLGEELKPGLWRWTAYHEEWKKEVAAYAVETSDELILVDPLLAPDQWEPLEAWVQGRELHVLLTIHYHARSSAEIAERLPGTQVWAHSRGRAAIARRTQVTDVFSAGDPLPADIEAIEARPRSEVLFWEPRSRALLAGDALLGDGERGSGLHTCPRSWLPRSSTIEDLRGTLRGALELPIDLVLPSHGAPVLADGKRKLARVAQNPSLR
ncbi:MAG TPA: MBL fold metallo-hydrolase [Solirubrobacterales bacterium]|nr:MBL fold metallo-hydrolase [Solirubrobacterales bacterium]